MNANPRWPLFLSLLLAAVLCPPVLADDDDDDDFIITKAKWHTDIRTLIVTVDTDDDESLFTLTGFPESTGISATFFNEDGKKFRFRIPIAEGQGVPCQVTVSTATASRTVGVKQAPIGCDNVVAIVGRVVGGPDLLMTNGQVTVSVGDVAYTTTTDDDGEYSIDILSDSADDFVTVDAEGCINNDADCEAGATEPIALRAYGGSVGRLQGLSAAAEIAEPREFEWLRQPKRWLVQLASFLVPSAHAQVVPDPTEILISNVTTALSILIDEANGNKPPPSDEELNELLTSVDLEDVIAAAATITMIVTGELDLADVPGVDKLKDLLKDPSLLEGTIEVAEMQPTFEDNVEATLSNPEIFEPVDESSVVGTQFEAQLGRFLSIPTIFEFVDGGTGTQTVLNYTISFLWEIEAGTGALHVNYTEIRTWGTRSFNRNDCSALVPEPPGGCDLELLSARFSRLNDGLTIDPYSVIYTYQLRSRDDPSITSAPLELSETTYFVEPDGLVAFDEASAPGLYGTEVPWFFADSGVYMDYATKLQLDAGGTGTWFGNPNIPDLPSGDPVFPATAITWTVNADGSLTMGDAVSGNQLTVYRLAQFGETYQTAVVYDFGDGTSLFSANNLHIGDPAAAFDPATVEGRYLIFSGPNAAPGDGNLGFRFDAGNVGALEIVDENQNVIFEVPWGWELEAATGDLVATRYRLFGVRVTSCTQQQLDDGDCIIERTRRIALINQDADFNYVTVQVEANWPTPRRFSFMQIHDKQ